ncbi:inositol-pentakisphosphate 2-kinase-like [Gastrolobium bilobum]|uniref:inositol-pentakisphosphate 2-kinase-like n=1 Tax=Gastrolobium bilobum TaxID=150636 RepID=UPI002AB0E2E2|nr:inositol-pentakisphosphate 2-kinase-like [Gastrolobium bilobum]XP_061350835.1 inositol-pentakisphosphate 2-kinase-like [Gastrolobium bilobum]
MEVILREKNAAEWVYRGEGAANLVLAYTGSSPAFIGKVMRIRKAPTNDAVSVRSPSALTAHERLLWKDVDELVSSSDHEIAGQLFVCHVMKPLLGSKYVDPGMLVLVSREFLESVQKDVICQRPPWRVDTAQVDTHCDSVLLMSDHSLFTHGNLGSSPCISVEIKPKCGFLPLSRFISKETAIKRRITRFEMHQALKLHQGEISLLSEYNPLDLFSGSKERIHKAIKDLFTTPQNNFRVFMNGSLIFGGLGGGAEDTNFCIAKAFEDELKSVIQADDGLCTENLLTLVAEALQKSGVLDRLLDVQKLDNDDIEGVIHAYYDITCQQCMVCRELSEEEVKRYTSLHSASFDESLRIVKDYLIAATAKDCSLIICFRPRKEGDSGSVCNNVYLESTEQTFDYKVYFIDLDLKHLSKMEEYYELDKKIVSCYREMIKMNQGRNKVANLQAS